MSAKNDLKKEGLTNEDIVLYVLYNLGGISKKVHTEHIAWESFLIAKERFSWSLKEYRDKGFPDKTTARYALEQAKKKNLVIGRAGKGKGGSISEGWQFTPEGSRWISENLTEISKKLKSREPLSKELPLHIADRLVKSIKNKKIFSDYKISKNIENTTIYDFLDMLNCSPDASTNIILNQFNLLKSNVVLLNDAELKRFIELCEEKFSFVLESQQQNQKE